MANSVWYNSGRRGIVTALSADSQHRRLGSTSADLAAIHQFSLFNLVCTKHTQRHFFLVIVS